jgi:hypothetical protein
MRKLKEEYEKWGLAINLEKTKYVCMGEGKEILKFDGGEEIKPRTECTYLGTKIDQLGDNTTEIKHRISQTRKAINSLNSISPMPPQVLYGLRGLPSRLWPKCNRLLRLGRP